MRNRALLISVATVLVTGATLVAAQDQGVQSIIGNVFLQNSTPGTAQVGHATITGTIRAGQIFVQQGSNVTIPVVGNNTANGDIETFGGSFSSAARHGQGVRGTATHPLGAGSGVIGISRGGGFGVRGISDRSDANTGAGVLGETNSKGTGVVGISRNGGFGVRGISGLSDATSGAGVQGESRSLNVPAIHGLNLSGTAVFGQSQTGKGVVATSLSHTQPALVASNNGSGTGDQKGAELLTH